MQHFIPFKKYSNAALAQETQQLLEANGIVCRLADNGASLDGSFGRGFTDYEIQLYHRDFERAETLLEERAGEWINELPDNYYLFSFTEEELYEVIQKKDEWNEIDYVLAKKLLADRGKQIDESLIKEQEIVRLKQLAQPEDVGNLWIGIGYTTALLGGFLGILSGYMLRFSKKTLPNGSKVYAYNERNRSHGRYILYISIVVLAFCIYYRFYTIY